MKMPLAMMETGAVRQVTAIRGDDAVKKHLHELGFIEGAEVEIISSVAGNLIVGLYGSRLAINRDLAMRIMV